MLSRSWPLMLYCSSTFHIISLLILSNAYLYPYLYRADFNEIFTVLFEKLYTFY